MADAHRAAIREACLRWSRGTSMSYDVGGWDQLLGDIGNKADQWFEVIAGMIDESDDHDEVMAIARGPLPGVLTMGGGPMQQRAVDWAQTESKRVAALFHGLALTLSRQGDGESLAAHALGLNVVADACARQTIQLPNRLSWDLWTVEIAIQMTESDPQFIWDLLQLVVGSVPPENLGPAHGAIRDPSGPTDSGSTYATSSRQRFGRES